jgi:hypothetical protein
MRRPLRRTPPRSAHIHILSAVSAALNPRTVELFRQVRSEPAIRGRQKLCEQSDQYAFAHIRAETLADEE